MKLSKDAVQEIGKYIDDNPQDWNNFMLVFKNHHQAINTKKNKVLSQPVWIKICVSNERVRIDSFHLEKPTELGYGWCSNPMDLGKYILIELTMKFFIQRYNKLKVKRVS